MTIRRVRCGKEILLGLFCALILLPSSAAQFDNQRQAKARTTSQKMPVREVMVFKDAHAFVLRELECDPGPDFSIEVGDLPQPVLGTFWPYVSKEHGKLVSVVVATREEESQVAAETIPELMAANPGAAVIVTENDGSRYSATIKTNPSPQSRLAYLDCIDGTKVVPLSRIREITFRGEFKKQKTIKQSHNVMTLKMVPAHLRERKVKVGMAYLQRGIRWIPNYQIDIDGKGSAHVTLRATLVNDLCDLENVAMRLVVGVPKFDFAHLVDPMALQAVLEAAVAHNPIMSNFRNDLASNRISSQQYSSARVPDVASVGSTFQDQSTKAGSFEDLFVYSLENLSLKKGARMQVPLAEFKLNYEDIYTLEVPFSPPLDLVRSRGSTPKLAPKIVHNLRLKNGKNAPLTTGPAVFKKQGQLIAQGLVRYTSKNGVLNLPLTTALDLRTYREERETKRDTNAIRMDGDNYHRVDYGGSLALINESHREAKLEVVRYLVGHIEKSDDSVQVETLSPFDDFSLIWGENAAHSWSSYRWPSWWRHVNSIGRVKFECVLKPGESKKFDYSWYYYWR